MFKRRGTGGYKLATISTLIGAMILSIAPANAQEENSWSGFSVAVGGGASQVEHDTSVASSVSDDLDLTIRRRGRRPFFTLQADGRAQNTSILGDDDWAGFGTIQAAYDLQFGNFVVGTLIDFDFYPAHPGSSVNESFDGAVDVSGTFFRVPFGPINIPIADYASISSNVELRNVWSVGGRLGFLVNPNTLLYALGGYTEAKINGQAVLSYTNVITGPQTLTLNMSDKLQGFFIGGGGEIKFTDNLALRLEYRYARYQSESKDTSATFSESFVRRRRGIISALSYQNTATINADVDADIHSVRTALVFKLGNP